MGKSASEYVAKIRERAYAIWEGEGRPEGGAERHWTRAEDELRAEDRPDRPRDEAAVDATVDDSFPASDPPAWTSETGAGRPKAPS